jgi:hypothetical protein
MISQCIIAKGEFAYDYCWSNCSTILLFQGSCFFFYTGGFGSFLFMLANGLSHSMYNMKHLHSYILGHLSNLLKPR